MWLAFGLAIISGKSMSDQPKKDNGVVTIKKYANRRLYNTATSSYVTLDYLCQMVKENIDFVVVDAKSGEDITRSVLTQIIVEEESKGNQSLLPINFLRQIISFYGDNMKQALLPNYLDASMSAFIENQEKMQQYMHETLDSVFPFGNLEEINKQNMNLLENTMQMFNPFMAGGKPEGETEAKDEKPSEDDQLQNLQDQIKAMQEQLKSIQVKKN